MTYEVALLEFHVNRVCQKVIFIARGTPILRLAKRFGIFPFPMTLIGSLGAKRRFLIAILAPIIVTSHR